MIAASRLGQDLGAHQQRDLDSDPGEPDAGAPDLRARRDVVIARELASPHAGAVVGDRDGWGARIGIDGDAPRARVERVGDDLGEDRLLGGAGIRVA